MVRSAATRSTKYEKKLDGDVWNVRYEALKPMMVEQINAAYAVQVHYEAKISDYLERQGMFGIQKHHYMNFGFECWRLRRQFTSLTRTQEVRLRAEKWIRRGLIAEHLIQIARLFGVTLVV